MSEGRWVLVIASGAEGTDYVSDPPWSGVAFLKHPVGMAFHQCFGESLLRFDRCEGAVKWFPPNRDRRRPSLSLPAPYEKSASEPLLARVREAAGRMT